MKFIISVTVHGDAVYDIDAEDENEARKAAKEKALGEFKGGAKTISVLNVHLLCHACKKAMWSESNYCHHCGAARMGRGQKNEKGFN